MANSTIHLLPAGNTEAISDTFEVFANDPVSLYLIPTPDLSFVAGSAQIILQYQSGAAWINADALNGSSDPCAVLYGMGVFRAFRPAQQEAVGIDLVRTGA